MKVVTRAAAFLIAFLVVIGLVSPSVAAAQQSQQAPAVSLTKDDKDKDKEKNKKNKRGIENGADYLKKGGKKVCDSPVGYVPLVAAGCGAAKVVKKGPKKALKDAATDVAETALDPFASNAAKFVGDMMKTGITWWLMTPSLTVKSSGVLDTEKEEGDKGKKGKPHSDLGLQAIMLGIGIMIAILLTIFQGIRTMIQRKGTPILQVVQGLMMNFLVIAVGVTVIDSLIVAADKLTMAILSAGFGDGGKEAPSKMVTMLLPTIGNPAGVLFIAAIVFVVGVVQLALLFARQAAIPVQALLLPIAGAGQVGADSTRKWLPRLITAILSCILYKPAAALIFAVGFVEMDNSSSLVDWLRGVMTLILSIFALKALLGLFAPVGEVIGGAAAGAGAGGLAGGLMQLAGGMSNGGGSGGGSSGGPPGPPGQSAVGQAGHMDSHGPAAKGGGGNKGDGGSDGPSEAGSSAVKQSNTQIPQQQQANASGQTSATQGAGTGQTASGGTTAGGGGAAAGGPAAIAIVAAEAAKKGVDKGGNTMGGGE